MNNAESAARKPDDWYEIRRLTQLGWGVSEIASALGCSTRKVNRARDFFGIKKSVGGSPWTPEIHAAVQACLVDRWSHCEIARTLKIDRKAIARHYPGTGLTETEIRERAMLGRKLAALK